MTEKRTYNKPIRWGILGCGSVTEVKSGPAYLLTEGFEVVAVMRRNEEKAKEYAKRHGIEKYYTNADDLINDPTIDAIYVATPPDSHMLYALKVATAGKICCVEKPLAPSYKDCLTIYTAFKEKNIPLFVAYYRRSLPRFNQVNMWLKDNAIGEVRHINWNFSKAPNSSDLSGIYNWRTDPKIAPAGYFDDLASHGLDLFTFLLGDVKEASGISHNQQGLYEAKDAVTACWLHENGITGSGSWNFGCNEYEDKVTVYGSKGTIEFSVFEENPIRLNSQNEKLVLVVENPKHIQLYHVENMRSQLISEDFKHPSTGETATHTSWIMDKILEKI